MLWYCAFTETNADQCSPMPALNCPLPDQPARQLPTLRIGPFTPPPPMCTLFLAEMTVITTHYGVQNVTVGFLYVELSSHCHISNGDPKQNRTREIENESRKKI
jgi:hypothetical protein